MDLFANTEAHRLFCYHLVREFGLSEAIGSVRINTAFCDGAAITEATLDSPEGGRSASASASVLTHHTAERAAGVSLGEALWVLLSPIAHSLPPYGTLVGVRPVKIALFYLLHGDSADCVSEILTENYHVTAENASLLLQLAQRETHTANALSDADALLYLSIPFCPTRCHYCSFVSHSAPQQLSLLPDYLAHMEAELLKTAQLFSEFGFKLRAVYLGGGTPGLLEPEQLSHLFGLVKTSFPLSESVEYTAELGRPDTITLEKLSVLHTHGVERVCVNPQSLSDEVLRQNGRAHSAEDFFKAFSLAREAKIPIINTDLIAGLPGDTPQGFEQSLAQLFELHPENITLHALCLKRAAQERSPFSAVGADWGTSLLHARRCCIKRGYSPYYLYRQKNTLDNLENLGYERADTACLYNIAMMEDLCHVFAVGAGAMTKLALRTQDGQKRITRLAAYKYPSEYLSRGQKSEENLQKARTLLSEEQE